MKILIGQSYFRVLDSKELHRNMPYPPFGSLYAATILDKLGYEVVFFDSMLSSNTNEFVKTIKSEAPDLLIIYDDEFNYLTKMCLSNMRGAAISFIKTAKDLSIPIVIYSSDAADFPRPYLEAGCDVIIYGEGEVTLKEVVQAFENKQFDAVKEQIAGLKFIKNNNIFLTAQRKLITNLDTLPEPDYGFVNMELYKKIWITGHNYFSLNISTTRGCPYSCNWCAKPLYGRSYTSRSPQRVVSQINELKLKYGADHIWITDDIFGLKTNWLKEFSDELKSSGLKIRYKCLSRPDLLLKGNTIQELKNSGCETIWIGAESGSQKILDGMDKGTMVEQIYEASERVHNAGMEIAFFIQLGYTNENWGDILLTRKMIRRCLPEDIGISVSYPLPGTVFYERVKKEMKLKSNWRDSDDLDMIFNGTFDRKFYKLLHRMIHYEYRTFKIVKRKQYRRIINLIYYVIKFMFFRFRLNKYLKKGKLLQAVQTNPDTQAYDYSA
jgi:anaerobic magnesium-protoporphyrin IX monomethyl ester cyclase